MSAAARRTGSASTPTSTAIEKFNFHGDELDVVRVNDEPYVVLGRLCATFELDVKTQADKLKSLSWATWGIFPVVAGDGKIRDVVCLHVRSVAGWLFRLNAGKVASHLKDKLAIYQSECADVLADHFLGRRITPANDVATITMVTEMRATMAEMQEQIRALAMNQGTISGDQAEWISGQIEVLANMRVLLGYNPSPRSAKARVHQDLCAAVKWGGTGALRRHMPAAKMPDVRVFFDTMHRMLNEEASRGTAHGRAQVTAIKRALQGKLFGNTDGAGKN